MSDGNERKRKFSRFSCLLKDECPFTVDVIGYPQQRQATILPLQRMGTVLLDTMQGALICLDRRHIILEASSTIKRYFGFEQVRLDVSDESRWKENSLIRRQN